MKEFNELNGLIDSALKEDVGPGDITTIATISPDSISKADFLLKADGVLAGIDFIEYLFNYFDPSLKFEKLFNDGEFLKSGKIIAAVEGNTSSILTLERTALNFLQRMSGIATATKKIIDEVSHTRAKIIDTRKTAPGLRTLDKLAVKLGGGTNHRIGLYDMFLIKDNHIAAAGSITNAINACKEFMRRKSTKFKIEVETKNIAEVEEALKNDPDVIMLDNFSVEKMREAVSLINNRVKVEASGGVNLKTVKAIAETGVDFISIGALTHSVIALDISLNITAR